MSRSVIKTVLVIGDNHEEIIKKYSMDTVVEPYIFAKRSEAKKKQKIHINLIKNIIESNLLKLTVNQIDYYKDLYQELINMSDFDYYMYITKGCYYDEKTFDAYSTINPNAHYKYEKCYDKRLKTKHEEASFSNPFKLKNGSVSYIAKYDDIDWNAMHMANTDIYRSAWELIVDGREPKSDIEVKIKNNMANSSNYFDNFKNVDEYIRHSCSFWCYGVATEDKYEELTYDIPDKKWVSEFYNNYIKDLKDNPTLSIYEVRTLND